MIDATECSKRAGKYAFGLDEAKTAQTLRKLADDIEAGVVVLYSVSTSSYAEHEEFTVRELVIEVLEDTSSAGPCIVKR